MAIIRHLDASGGAHLADLLIDHHVLDRFPVHRDLLVVPRAVRQSGVLGRAEAVVVPEGVLEPAEDSYGRGCLRR